MRRPRRRRLALLGAPSTYGHRPNPTRFGFQHMRDDFPKPVLDTLAKRVGYRCSNPACRKLTSGPHTDDTKVLNVGVGSHITAASPGGPRYDPSLSQEQRRSQDNGIWLCQNCGKLVDNDEARYGKEVLFRWKQEAEQAALKEVESSALPALLAFDSFRIVTHIGTVEAVSMNHCDRHGKPLAPEWLPTNPTRMGSEWLAERLTSGADLRLFFDPKWCGGTWFVADLRSGDGVVINLQQLSELRPPSPTTTTTPAPPPLGNH